MRWLKPQGQWREGPLKVAFWCLNIGLAMMVLLSLLPIGILQALASVDHGLWHARSAEFMQQDHMQILRWMRMPGDAVFLFGVATLVYWALGIWTGRSFLPESLGAVPKDRGAHRKDEGRDSEGE